MEVDFNTIEEGKELYKRAVSLRNKMCGSMWWSVHNDNCNEIAKKLIFMGVSKEELENISSCGN